MRIHVKLLTILLLCGTLVTSCKSTKTSNAPASSVSTAAAQTVIEAPKDVPKVYSYQTFKNDPLNARVYTLDNGFKVYMTVYKDAPRIQTYIATKAGSKNDPADATGLAHYLEHMLFKGTDKYGTLDFAKEKPELDKIEVLYELYRNTKDDKTRNAVYHQIDSISGVAAKFSIANEYDKMISALGSKGNNAFTSFEQTVYVNDIPSNQLENWLSLESERFRHPVLRIFHTELEAVYEEKNRSLDSDDNKLFEAMFSNLFKKHTYGSQTTIGTIEHLKNPSLLKIKDYYNTYYVPNNMALILSGDFNPDEAIKMIDSKFGSLPYKAVPAYKVAVEEPIAEPRIVQVLGPDAESLAIGYRFGGVETSDADMVKFLSKIIYNGTAGLFDLYLNQQQKVLEAYSFPYLLNDYSTLILGASPKEGQTLEQTKTLMLEQIERLKKADFPDWILAAIVTDLKVALTKSYGANRGRADDLLDAFTANIDYQRKVDEIGRFEKITKQQLVEFANKNLQNNYVLVYKHTGEDTSIQKVVKPIITPVEVNRNAQSEFLKSIVNAKVPAIEPVFLDYKKDIQEVNLKNNIPLFYKKNTENNTFSMYYILDMGTNNDKKAGIAIDYLNYLGTSKLSPSEVQEAFYKLGCRFEVYNSEEQIYVSLNGLAENFEKATILFESLLSDAQPNKTALSELIEDALKKRADAKLSKDEILQRAMRNYAKYGAKSPYTNILSEKELRALKPAELISIIKSLTGYQHRVLYFGPEATDNLVSILNAQHKTPELLKDVPTATEFPELETTADKIYVVNYDMKQAEILSLSKGETYSKNNAAKIALFNEYFGGGMGSIVFQTMRESKALAYGVYASFGNPTYANRAHYVSSYIGTQADKLPEAMAGMDDLMNNIPHSENLFEGSKTAVIQKIRTERITKEAVLFNFERARKLGLDYDIRSDVFLQIPAITFADLEAFSKQHVKGKKYTRMVLGDKKVLDMKTLNRYGKVEFLNLKDVFGY
ncbi:MAG: insulinase family protein [Bacteroidetes bacterium]|nr:insulinase family protein [Bacteroidota bacterium]